MLELMKYCNNYFKYSIEPRTKVELKGSAIKGTKGKYLKGQYILIENTILNNGLYLITDIVSGSIIVDSTLNEEVTECIIYGLNVPNSFKELFKEYSEYIKTKGQDNGLTSESFEGYSYTKATNKEGRPLTPIEVFADKLKPYRQMYDKRQFKEVY